MMEHGLITIHVALIDDSVRLRPLDDAYVDLLAQNIASTGGLRQPIEVRIVKGGGYRLIAGGHRLAAMRRLGHEQINAFVRDMTDEQAALAEIDENLVRHDLNPLDRAVFLHRRKELYEALHPETRAGVAGAKARQGEANEILSFAADTAARVGMNRRTIELAVRIATRLDPQTRARLAGTGLARNQTELLALVKLPPEEQRAVIDMLLSANPPARSVGAVHRLLTGGQTEEIDADSAAFSRMISAWGRGGDKARRMFLVHLKLSGDLVKYGPGKAGAAPGATPGPGAGDAGSAPSPSPSLPAVVEAA